MERSAPAVTPGQATGNTTRAVLWAAEQLSAGKTLVLAGRGPEEDHFVQRLLDLCNFLQIVETYDRVMGRITTKGGGVLRRYSHREHLRGLRNFIEIENI